MEQPTSVSTIRLYFESEAFEVLSGEVVVFPARPSEEIMTQIRQGTFQVSPVSLIGNVAPDVLIYGAGHYSGALGNLSLRARQGDKESRVPQVPLPQFMISQGDIEKGECRVVLPAVATLKVTVVDNQGRTAVGKKVCVMEPGRSCCGETDAAGAFTVQLGVGQYMVTVTDGESRQVDLRESFDEKSIVLRQPGRSCRVLLVDSQGEPRPRCTHVRAVREEEGSGKVTPEEAGSWSAFAAKGIHRSTCEDGSAYFTGLEPGTYRFEALGQPSGAVSVKIEDFEPHAITLVCE